MGFSAHTVLTGIVFPGQGSQRIGMLKEVSEKYPIVLQTFEEASAILGYDLWKLTQEGPVTELDKTVHTQPALLTAGYAMWRVLQETHPTDRVILAGHSLGEYTALVAAKAISFPDAVKVVAARGQFMQEAVPVGCGALAALVGLEDSEVQMICEHAKMSNEILAPANFNCPGQVVIAGHIAAVERAIILAKEKGAKLAMRLPVSVPSHCALMKPAAIRLSECLEKITIQSPLFPVINNVDVNGYEDAASIRDGLTRQLYLPVRWVETIQRFIARGVTSVIECGPGKVLSGLIKRIHPDLHLTQLN